MTPLFDMVAPHAPLLFVPAAVLGMILNALLTVALTPLVLQAL